MPGLNLQGRADKDGTVKSFIGCWEDLTFNFVRQDTIEGFLQKSHALNLQGACFGFHIENRITCLSFVLLYQNT